MRSPAEGRLGAHGPRPAGPRMWRGRRARGRLRLSAEARSVAAISSPDQDLPMPSGPTCPSASLERHVLQRRPRFKIVPRDDGHAQRAPGHRRARLCRPAARDGLRRGGLHVTGIDLNEERVQAVTRAALLSGRRAGRALRGRRRPADRHDRLRGGRGARRADDLRADAAVEDAHAGPDLHRVGGRVGRRAPAAGPARSCCSPRPIRARPRRSCCRSSSRAAARRRGLLPGLRARARGPGQPHYWHLRNTPSSSPASRDECLRRTGRSTRRSSRRSSPVEHDGRRDRQAPREHLPRGEHRAGQRARAHVRPAGDLGLGGHRRRLLPSRSPSCRTTRARAWAATASRSCRTSWPGACASTATPRADRRRPRGQRVDAATSSEGRRRAQRGRAADQRLAAPAARHGLQGQRARHARVAEPRDHAPAARARRRRALLRPVRRSRPSSTMSSTMRSR